MVKEAEFDLVQPPRWSIEPIVWKPNPRLLGVLAVGALEIIPLMVRGDCSLTRTGNIPLPDLGAGLYQGFQGGLYPNGSDIIPESHAAAGLAQAAQVQPLNSAGV